MSEPKRDIIESSVVELAALERHIEDVLAEHSAVVRAYPQATAASQTFLAIARSHQDALAAYLRASGGSGGAPAQIPSAAVPTLPQAARAGIPSLLISDALRHDHMLFSYAASGYARLAEMAFKLYEPDLREIGPRHLQEYAEAAQAIDRIIAGVVGWELEQEGLWCQCICPMCSIGACGCVAAGSLTIERATHLPAPHEQEAEAQGFALQTPKPGSGLALAGVHSGDRLLAVDGRPVQTFVDIQAAIRKHAIGEELTVRVQSGSDAPRDIKVRHVSDYRS